MTRFVRDLHLAASLVLLEVLPVFDVSLLRAVLPVFDVSLLSVPTSQIKVAL